MDDQITGAVYRGGPYDGTTEDHDPEREELPPLSVDGGPAAVYRRRHDRVERVHGRLCVVYEYAGAVED